MISEEEILRLKETISPVELAQKHGLILKRSGSEWVGHCPFHNEKTPSFYVRELGSSKPPFHCFGCGWAGDVIKFERERSGLSFVEACERLGAKNDQAYPNPRKLAQMRREARERTREAEEEEEAKKAKKRASWPEFDLGSDDEIVALAELRGIHPSGPWLARRASVLRFTYWKGHRAWIIGDSRRTIAQARRLDGGPWPNGSKAWTLPGSKLKPIGLVRSPHPVILTEGGPDLLDAWARLRQRGALFDERGKVAVQVVCMLGSSSRLDCYAEWLKGREVTIFVHNDKNKAGEKAAQAWANEALKAGAAGVKAIQPQEVGADFNDLTK